MPGQCEQTRKQENMVSLPVAKSTTGELLVQLFLILVPGHMLRYDG
jgi:hypothetical protein